MNGPIAIVMNGSINSGKTSVSKALQKIVPELAHVEVDDLGAFVEWMPLDQQIPLNLKNAGLVARVFLDAGISVVISYPLTEHEHASLARAINPYAIYTFTLSPALGIAQSNRGSRKLEKCEIERIAYHYEIGISKPSFGIIIDNGNESPDESARRIWASIKEQTDQSLQT